MYSSSDPQILLCTENIRISKLSSPLNYMDVKKPTKTNLMNFIFSVITMYHYTLNDSSVK